MNSKLIVLVVTLLAAYCKPSLAVETLISGNIQRLYATHDGDGGCMVKMAVPVQGVDGLTCGQYNYVHFNCAGEQGVGTRADGLAKFNIAQLAFVTDRPIRMRVSDRLVINGRCFAEFIDVVN